MGVIINTIPQSNKEESVSVNTDGVKTIRQLLNELYALVDLSKITPKATLTLNDGSIMQAVNITNLRFFTAFVYTSNFTDVFNITIASSNSTYCGYHTSNNTYTDYSNNVPPAGKTITITY